VPVPTTADNRVIYLGWWWVFFCMMGEERDEWREGKGYQPVMIPALLPRTRYVPDTSLKPSVAVRIHVFNDARHWPFYSAFGRPPSPSQDSKPVAVEPNCVNCHRWEQHEFRIV